MVSMTTVLCCLMVLANGLLEVTAIRKRCDATVDITIGMDASPALSDEEYNDQKELVLALIDNLLPGPNDVTIGAMFYSSGPLDIYYSSGKEYARFEQKEALKTAVMKSYDREEGEDALLVPYYMSTAERYDFTARHIGIFIADAVFNRSIVNSNIEIIALEVGNSSSLKILENYLENVVKEHRIIKFQNFLELNDAELLNYLTDEICRGTIKKSAYEEVVSNEVITSYVYLEHTYYLSRGIVRNLKQVTDVCSKLGGYLARINDQLEYAAMQKHLLSFTEPQIEVLVDGTNAKHNGNCTFYSGEPMSFRAPENELLDDWCQFTSITLCNAWVPRYNLFRRIDCKIFSYNQIRFRFLCEVPGKGDELWRLTMGNKYSTDINFAAFKPSKPYEGYWV